MAEGDDDYEGYPDDNEPERPNFGGFRPQDSSLLARARALYEAANYADNVAGATQRGSLLRRRAGNKLDAIDYNVTPSSTPGEHAYRRALDEAMRGLVSGEGISDFKGEFDPTTDDFAIRQLSRMAGRAAQRRGGNFDRAVNRSSNTLGEKTSEVLGVRHLEGQKDRWRNEYEPAYQQAMSGVSDLMGKSAISAGKEQELRSAMAGQVRSQEASALSRISSGLGLRGLMDSPASAALASRAAVDYDSRLVANLSDLGLKVTEMNQDAVRRNSSALAELATVRQAAEQSYLTDDYRNVADMGRRMAELTDSLYNRNYQQDLFEKMYDDSQDRSWMDDMGQFVDIGQGIASIAGSFMGYGGGGGMTGAYQSQKTTPQPYGANSFNGEGVSYGGGY